MTALSPDPTGPDSTPDEPGPDDTSRFRSGPGFFPGVVVPAWVVLHPDVDEGALAVAAFIAAYRSGTDDRMPFVGRKTIARRFGRSVDWVDARTRVLCEIGYLAKVAVYRDNLTGERTLAPFAADDSKNPRSSNDWLFSDVPPAGDHHPHPVMSSEHGNPGRVTKRIADRERIADAVAGGVAAPQRPGSEQRKHGKTPARGVAAPQRPPQPLPSGHPSRSPAALTKTKGTDNQTNQPRTPGTHVTPGTGSGGLVGGEDEGTDKAVALLSSLPVRTPLPGSTVTALTPHVASLLTSGWTAGELTEHLTTGLPPSYGVGLIVQRVRDTRPRTTTAETATDRIAARIDDLAARMDDSGARRADQILGTREWTPPARDGHTTVEYLTRVLPAAAAEFVEARRDRLAEVMSTHPAWRLGGR